MHLNPDGADHKDNGKPPTLVTSMIDYNMPITMAYMKHMKLQLLNSQQDEDESSIESDEFDLSDSTRMSAVNSDLSSNLEERIQSPQTLQGQQDDPMFSCPNSRLNILFDKPFSAVDINGSSDEEEQPADNEDETSPTAPPMENWHFGPALSTDPEVSDSTDDDVPSPSSMTNSDPGPVQRVPPTEGHAAVWPPLSTGPMALATALGTSRA
uniref:Uncharacterized protein n=1 Tax=Sphaerodactylus townsendi TaxID=933632 RepID=A0ACB8FDU6_9SAUR